MPDRAIIPLMAAATGGFIVGVIVAVREVYGGSALIIGVIVGLLVVAAGLASVIGIPGERDERLIVGGLRGAVGAACFGFLYAGMLSAVRDGKIVGVLFMLVAGGFAALLTRFRVRDRVAVEPTDRDEQPAS
jgi:hypothetical protein